MKKSIVMGLFFLSVSEFAMATGDYIELYNAYTNGSRVIVKGRVIDVNDKKTKESSPFSAFFNDEKKWAKVYLEIEKERFVVESDNEAYFTFDVKPKSRLKRGESILLKTEDANSLQKVEPFFPSLKEHIGVISDFDDTVLVSDVTSNLKLLYNTFLKDYKERKVIVKISQKIKTLMRKDGLQEDKALFFISGSPHQLNNTINSFLDYHHFQKHMLLTKKIHGDVSESLHTTIACKYDKIVRLIEMYPKVKWVLLGDSGERDAEVYWKVRKHYPSSVKAIYIRDVESKKVKKIENELSVFTTDGCSYFPNGGLENNKEWLSCCIEHDKSYWKGGTKEEREEADSKLKVCVKKVGFPTIAEMMYLGVRIGGSAEYDTNYKWGYGWKINRHNEPLSSEELSMVNKKKEDGSKITEQLEESSRIK